MQFDYSYQLYRIIWWITAEVIGEHSKRIHKRQTNFKRSHLGVKLYPAVLQAYPAGEGYLDPVKILSEVSWFHCELNWAPAAISPKQLRDCLKTSSNGTHGGRYPFLPCI